MPTKARPFGGATAANWLEALLPERQRRDETAKEFDAINGANHESEERGRCVEGDRYRLIAHCQRLF